jgi:hypothetical protein
MAFKSKKLTDAGALYEYAVGALGRKMRSVAELKRLLRQRVAAQRAEVPERFLLRRRLLRLPQGE